MIHVTEAYNRLELTFQYDKKILEAVKAIPGAKFNFNQKTWSVPKDQSGQVRSLVQKFTPVEMLEEEKVGDVYELPELTIDIPLKRNLFPYQRKGVAYSLDKKRVLIGDQPGLGKTGQAIATVTGANAFPALVICPSSIKINWQREWELWTNHKAVILDDRLKHSWTQLYKVGLANVFIVNYESLKKYFVNKVNRPKGKALRITDIEFNENIQMFKSVIIDESHRCKDAKTLQAKFVKGLSIGKEYILALSGTPVVNNPKDLIAQLGILDQLNHFGGYKHFINRYCGGGRGATNLKELNYLLTQHCFYRRDKSEVLKDLPAKMRQVVLCDIDNRKEYNDALHNLEDYLKEYKKQTDSKIQQSMKGEVMVRIGILKNISARGKMKGVCEFISDILEQGEKLVVFIHLKEIAEELIKNFPHAVTIRGGDSMDYRQQSVDKFQNDKNCNLIICSIKAAGVGLTLTASSRVAFVEQGWHAADMEQCEDRCHRIGQQDSVQCFYFLGRGTIDEKIYKLIDGKREVANTITGAENNVEVNIIDSVINLFTGHE